MPVFWILAIVLVLGAAGYVLGRARALSSAGDDYRSLHSLPSYYGWNAFILTVVPALLVLAAWMLIAPIVIDGMVSGLVDEGMQEGSNLSLLMSDVRRLAAGLDSAVSSGALSASEASGLVADNALAGRLMGLGISLGSSVTETTLAAAQRYRGLAAASQVWMAVVVIALAAGGLLLGLRRINPSFRARNAVETGLLALLILASSIAILTTLGIVLSMLFETINFFRQYPASEFFFSTTWSPDFRGNSELGILPLLWGTLYISLIALLVAVPVGLFAAIYLSEYAGPKMRAVAKPLIEVLAGIPTIVYGLFALITVGPALRDYFAQPLGLGNSSSSVMTAGLVMGIMLIPFVSSLSDDIINAVPQSMRDGSLGLGATPSETIRSVIIPAALPGIVGAVLLAASRAIGETMIVVLGAGAAAARLNEGLTEAINPFEAMTTVTVKIVSQLTGDTDFASPETLVAFALGLTLFVITLALNVLALYIVRKYREQYE
ncbi:phosphate ABC transporter permease subunit PstC [Tropicimonas sp. IMCC34011]|uniref:phosphate ABC transporter permease subunit PstC n=1 Tax=Tropicimonas sp. IMCC34011 TaxID=2248759 RepID=UPI000E2778C1|nr:phosphate ABC transporter permease subunit PstC [Tropicimonas sp. IMCC34011]